MIKNKLIKNKKANSHFDFLFGNKNLLKSKRSQIGSTLTWFVGFLVVLFVMLLFVGASISLAKIKGIDVNKEHVKYDSSASEAQRALLFFLESPTDTKEIKILDTILSSLDPYFEIKDKFKGKQSLIDWASKTYVSSDSLEKIDLNQAAYVFEEEDLKNVIYKNIKLGEELSKKMESVCSRYYLQIPQGVVKPGGLSTKKALGHEIFYDTDEKLIIWTPTVSFNIPYKGRIFEIKYRQLRNC